MSDSFLTLKDIAAREGTDDVVGLIEGVVNVAPEIDRIEGRVIRGISYTARVRKAIHAGRAFRPANAGTALGASSFEHERFNCFAFDAQMQIDEAVAIAAEADGDSLGKLMAEEAGGAMRSKAIDLGLQFYQGTSNDAYGPPGLVDFMVSQQAQLDSRTGAAIDQVVDAGGSTASVEETMWFMHMGPQGIHWLFGGGRGLTMNPWTTQYVKDSNGKHLRAYKANLFGYIGLSCANWHAVGAIKNIQNSTTTYSLAGHGVTDGMVATLWSKFPIGLKPNIAFASQKVIALLQQARSVTLFANATIPGQDNSGGATNVAPWPTNLPTAGGIPLVPTDSIQPGNAVTAY